MSTTETQARTVLREAIHELANSRGVNPHRVFKKKHSLRVELSFDGDAVYDVPPMLTEFMAQQYPGRRSGVDKINISYREDSLDRFFRLPILNTHGAIMIKTAHWYPRTPEQQAKEKQRVFLEKDEKTGLAVTESVIQLEKTTDYNYFIFPSEGIVKSVYMMLEPFSDPMKFSIAYHPMAAWLEAYKKAFGEESAIDRLRRTVDPINRIVDPMALGLTDKRHFILGIGENIEEVLDPDVIVAIAGLVSTKPALQTKNAFGVNYIPPQPSRQLVIV